MKCLQLLIILCVLVSCEQTVHPTKQSSSTKEPKEQSKKSDSKQKNQTEELKSDQILSIEEQKASDLQPLKVRVNDLLSKTATVDIRVYNTAEGFLMDGGAIATYRFKPVNGVAEFLIQDLKYGTYAMAIYQDLDESGKIGKNVVGIPNEPFAVSNDIKPGLGAPPFEACSFQYSEKEFEVVVHLLDGVL